MTTTIDIEVEGLDEVLNTLSPEKITGAMEPAFLDEVKTVFGDIQKTAPYRTGQYRRGWHYKVNKLEAEIGNNVSYAIYLIFGTERLRNFYGRVLSGAAHAGGTVGGRWPRMDLTRGILHDVRGILFEWSASLTKRLVEKTWR